MQNGAHTSHNLAPTAGRLVGFVRVLVGGHMHEVAVQAVSFTQDSDKSAGGFFSHDGQLGILVDDDAPAAVVQQQIEAATVEAVRHLSQRYFN